MIQNHIGKNAESKLISNAIEYDFQPRFCCTLTRILSWIGVAVLLVGIAVVLWIGAHPAL